MKHFKREWKLFWKWFWTGRIEMAAAEICPTCGRSMIKRGSSKTTEFFRCNRCGVVVTKTR